MVQDVLLDAWPEGRVLSFILDWPHRNGPNGPTAHCLAQLVETGPRPAVVLSDLASNPEPLHAAADFAGAATAFLAAVRPTLPLDPAELRWYLLHGWFSSTDPYALADPDTLTAVPLAHDGPHCRETTPGRTTLTPADTADTLTTWRLHPVPDTLARLRSPFLSLRRPAA